MIETLIGIMIFQIYQILQVIPKKFFINIPKESENPFVGRYIESIIISYLVPGSFTNGNEYLSERKNIINLDPVQIINSTMKSCNICDNNGLLPAVM